MKSRICRRILLAVSAAVFFAGSSPAQIYLEKEKQIGGVGVTVFRDENFRGENATFRQDVPDLKRYGFNDRITSLRVAPGEYWEACESPNYQGRCQVFSGDERNLRNVGWTDRISSLRRVRRGGGGGGVSGKFGIVLYDDPYFRGRSVTIKDPVDNLRFVKPVYVGDTIQARLTCKQKTVKEDREGQIPQGVVAWDVEVRNQSDEPVAVYTILTLVRRKN